MSKRNPRLTCAVAGCNRRVNGAPFGNHCSTHATNLYRNGATDARAIKMRELAWYREPVAKALMRYLNSSAVQSALVVADDLLSYRPPRDFTVHHVIAKDMARLRESGVTARDVLQRLGEVWMFHARTGRLKTARELAHTAARAVLKLRSRAGRRPTGVLLKYLGTILREDLGSFCTALVARIEHDFDVKARAKQAFKDGWAIRGEA